MPHTGREAEPRQHPSFADRLPLWWLGALVGAVAGNALLERFAPGLTAAWLPLEDAARQGVVVLMLMLAGVAVQALWWAIRTR